MFETSFFASPGTLLLGALTGLIFGFLLQRGGLTRFNTIVGQFLLRDFTVLKTMLTAVVVGSVGVYAMLQFGLIEGLHIKSTALAANIVGGAIFGIGMVILGYCPGTGIAAIGDGARDARFGALGMIVGAGIYAETYPALKDGLLTVGAYGKTTLPSMTGLSAWLFVGVIAVIAIILFVAIERLERRTRSELAS
jgi:uncharacterized membrane protein YedE/YeeE